jgi:hypothetical protein
MTISTLRVSFLIYGDSCAGLNAYINTFDYIVSFSISSVLSYLTMVNGGNPSEPPPCPSASGTKLGTQQKKDPLKFQKLMKENQQVKPPPLLSVSSACLLLSASCVSKFFLTHKNRLQLQQRLLHSSLQPAEVQQVLLKRQPFSQEAAPRLSPMIVEKILMIRSLRMILKSTMSGIGTC